MRLYLFYILDGISSQAKEMENGNHDTLPKPKLNDSLLVSTLNNRHSSSINNISSINNSSKNITTINSFGHNNSSGLNSSSTLNNRHSSSQSKLNSELKQSSLFQQNQETVSSKTSKFESTFSSSSTTKPDLYSKTPTKPVDFTKSDFGSFSILDTPKLLLGAKERLILCCI